MPIVVYEKNTVQVLCPNKAGNSSVIDIICYPFYNKFLARTGRDALVGKKYFTEKKHDALQIQIDKKIAIVRDPIERLKSCYVNRVLQMNKGNIQNKVKSWNYFVYNLENIQNLYIDIKKHSEPQNILLGYPENFDYIFNSNDINFKFKTLINNLSGVNIVGTSNQKASPTKLKETIKISNDEIKIIKKIYDKDYEIWGEYFL